MALQLKPMGVQMNKPGGRKTLVSFLLILGGFALIGILYGLLGHSFIDRIYQSKSFGFLNRMIVGQALHPLEYYTAKFDRLFKNAFTFVIPAVLLLWGMPHLFRRFSGFNKMFANCLLLFLSLAIAFLAAEGLARKLGCRPWDPHKGGRILVEPGGRLVRIDPVLGYALIPGKFSVTLKTGHVFVMTHDQNGLRITHPVSAGNGGLPEKKEIWILGCSFTHGWSLNDNQTYAWLLQEKFPEYEVVNFGSIGYGTLHAFLQFQEALKTRGKPAAVVYSYASFHDERNTFSRGRRKAIGPANELGPFGQPYARLDKTGNLIFSTSEMRYEELPFMRRSALINLLDEKVNAIQAGFLHSEMVTKAILEKFDGLARTEEIQFIAAGIDREAGGMLEYLQSKGVPAVDISVDLSQQSNRNWPHDSHPSAAANQEYAEKLADYLKAVL